MAKQFEHGENRICQILFGRKFDDVKYFCNDSSSDNNCGLTKK